MIIRSINNQITLKIIIFSTIRSDMITINEKKSNKIIKLQHKLEFNVTNTLIRCSLSTMISIRWSRRTSSSNRKLSTRSFTRSLIMWRKHRSGIWQWLRLLSRCALSIRESRAVSLWLSTLILTPDCYHLEEWEFSMTENYTTHLSSVSMMMVMPGYLARW